MISASEAGCKDPGLVALALEFIWNAMAPATRRTYSVGQRCWLNFAQRNSFAAFPLKEENLILWATDLATRVKYGTIRTYLSSVYCLHKELGFTDMFDSFHLLKRALRGMKRALGAAPTRPRLPITVDILKKFYNHLDTRKHEDSMLWAAMTTAFFGLLRSGEITGSSHGRQTPATVPKVRDLTCAAGNGLVGLTLRLHVSKTDPFRKGVNVYIGATGDVLCPLRAMENYLLIRYSQQRSNGDDALFVDSSGTALSYKLFTAAVKGLAASAGLSPQCYSGHSFRIGGATALARKGVPDHIIQALGRWSSDSYMLYLRLDAPDLLRMASIMSHS